jgi:hypothetical protein
MDRYFATRVAAACVLAQGLSVAGCSDGGSTITDPMPDSTLLRITVDTTGEYLDRNGFAITIDDVPERRTGLIDTVVFHSITIGSHAVRLDDVVADCAVAGGPERQVTVTEGNTTDVAFEVSCAELPPAAVGVPGTWFGFTLPRSTSSGADYDVTYELQQNGDDVTGTVRYHNLNNDSVAVFDEVVGRVSDSTFTLFITGYSALGVFSKITTTMEVSGDEMTGSEIEQLNLWSAELTLTKQ